MTQQCRKHDRVFTLLNKRDSAVSQAPLSFDSAVSGAPLSIQNGPRTSLIGPEGPILSEKKINKNLTRLSI